MWIDMLWGEPQHHRQLMSGTQQLTSRSLAMGLLLPKVLLGYRVRHCLVGALDPANESRGGTLGPAGIMQVTFCTQIISDTTEEG